MSFFSSSPKNRRRRSRSKSTRDSAALLDTAKEKPRSKKKTNDLGEQAIQLNARIGALESFLAKKTAAEERREQMQRDNILPPPDRASLRPAKKRRLSHAERRRYHAERNRTGIQFLFLFCLACGIAWWLIFSGI